MTTPSLEITRPYMSPEVYESASRSALAIDGAGGQIDQTRIVEDGAAALGAAVAILTVGPEGAEVGALIGKALLGLLVGSQLGGQSAFEAEVLSRLAVIDHKLDEVITLLSNLPPIITEIVAEGFAQHTADQLGSKQITVNGLVRSFDLTEGHLPAEGLNNMLVVGTVCLEYGYQLAKRGQQWYGAVTTAFACGLALLSRTMKHDRTMSRSVIASYAAEYLKFARGCTATAVPADFWKPAPHETLRMASQRLKMELETATAMLADLLRGPVTYLVTYEFRPASPPVDDQPGQPACVIALAAYFELLDGGRRLNGYPVAQGVPVPFPNATSRPQPVEVARELNKMYSGKYGFMLPEQTEFDKFPPYGFEAYNRLVDKFLIAISQYRNNPLLLAPLDIGVAAMEKLEVGAAELAKLA